MSATYDDEPTGRVFDLSADARAWYRFRRFGRWLMTIGFVVLAAVFVYRFAIGFPSILYPVLPLFIGIEAFLGWMVVRVLALGPTRLSISPKFLRLEFEGGRFVDFSAVTASRNLEFLVPRALAHPESRVAVFSRGFQIRHGLDVFAASEDSWEPILKWMTASGYQAREREGAVAGRNRRSIRFVPDGPGRPS